MTKTHLPHHVRLPCSPTCTLLSALDLTLILFFSAPPSAASVSDLLKDENPDLFFSAPPAAASVSLLCGDDHEWVFPVIGNSRAGGDSEDSATAASAELSPYVLSFENSPASSVSSDPDGNLESEVLFELLVDASSYDPVPPTSAEARLVISAPSCIFNGI